MVDQMDGKHFLNTSNVENDGSKLLQLSPITEMNESAEIICEEFMTDFDDKLKPKPDGVPNLDLEISVGNLENGLLQPPETPPEVLRVRLNSLQYELEELKEFTVLEKQTYHSDCIPREQVTLLEEELGTLNEKVQYLLQENLEYQNKLEIKDKEQRDLKYEAEKVLNIQNEWMILIEQIKKKLIENVKDSGSPIEGQHLSVLGKNEENLKDQNSPGINKFFRSLIDVHHLVDVIANEKNKLGDELEHFQLKITGLKETIEIKNQELVISQQNLSLLKSKVLNFQEELSKLERELSEIYSAYTDSEQKRLELEHTNDLDNVQINKLQNEIFTKQEQLHSLINTSESFVKSVIENSIFEKRLAIHEDLAVLRSHLITSDSCDISFTFSMILKVFDHLVNEIKLKDKECHNLQLNISQLNDYLTKYEADIKERQSAIKFLTQEVSENIPSRLSKLNTCLGHKDSEILRLKDNLQAANEKVEELSNKISEHLITINEMSEIVAKNSIEKINLENELEDIKKSFVTDDINTYISSTVTSLEHVIDYWDENSNLGNLISLFQENIKPYNETNSLINPDIQDKLNDVAEKYKLKLFHHDLVTNNLRSKLKMIIRNIEHLEGENEKLRSDVSSLNYQIKEELYIRVNDLENLFSFSDQGKQLYESTNEYTHNQDTYVALLKKEEENQKDELNCPKASMYSSGKHLKQINNFNKVIKPDECLDTNMYDLNEIENIIDSWDSPEKIEKNDFTHLINEKILKDVDKYSNPKVKVGIFCVIDKFIAKLTELLKMNSHLLQSLTHSIEENENKQITKVKEESMEINCEKEHKHDNAEEIKKIKKLMSLEITSLDENEDEELLMSDSVEKIFQKLMQTILLKEQEMSNNLEKNLKEELANFELTIEKLNNKLKSQKCWTNTLESENDKVNAELAALKNFNNSLDNKLKSLSNDINNKTLEIDILKRKNLELMTENHSIISDLDTAKDLIKKYKYSIACYEKDIQKLNEELENKSNVIDDIKSQLVLTLNKEDRKENILSPNTKENFTTFGENDKNLNNVKDHKGQLYESETLLLKTIEDEALFVKEMLEKRERNIAFGQLLLNCCLSLNVLKDLIQNIGEKILEFEASHEKDFQSIKRVLEYKTKELYDFNLNISDLYQNLVQTSCRDNSSQQFSFNSMRTEFQKIKSDFVGLHNKVEDFEETAKMGNGIVQSLKETLQTIIDENYHNEKLIHELRQSIDFEKKKNDKITKEHNLLTEKHSLLECEMLNLKMKLTHLKEDFCSQLEVNFPEGMMEESEKVAYVNKTLKQYAETQKACYVVTEELRFFGYHCELMLSYIQSLEYKLCFITQQKELCEKENTLLKGQVTTQNLEMSRFFHQLVAQFPFNIKTLNPHVVLEAVTNVFCEHKLLKENNSKLVNEVKLGKEKISLLEKKLDSSTKQNSSLKFELSKCEDSIRNLRSELRSSKCLKRESTCFDIRQGIVDAAVQTEGSCCKRLQKKITEQKEKLDMLAAKLNKSEQLHRSSLTNNPYNRQVSYLEGALSQAKERIGRLHLTLKQQERHNEELVETLKRHESCQQRLNEGSQ